MPRSVNSISAPKGTPLANLVKRRGGTRRLLFKIVSIACAVASVLFNVSPLKGAFVPLVKPVIVCPPDFPVYCITSL